MKVFSCHWLYSDCPDVLVIGHLGGMADGRRQRLFTQIRLFVLIGLACKNAILIVEFARDLEIRGKNTFEAAIEAAHLRLRPILMTSFAFIMGVVPLVLPRARARRCAMPWALLCSSEC